MVEIPLTKGMMTLIDNNDYQKISQHKWYYVPSYRRQDNGYAASAMRMADGIWRTVPMHRFILGLLYSDKMIVDHINSNGLDNRKSNLRVCSLAQNLANQRISKNNTSGFKGVYWSKEDRKWRVRLQVNKSRLSLGNYTCVINAAKAYNEAAIKYLGEFALLNQIP